MVKIYKFINRKQLDRFKGYIVIDGIVYTNEDGYNKAIEMGYKPLVIDEYQPPYNPETEMLSIYYEERIENIVQRYEVLPIEEPTEE